MSCISFEPEHGKTNKMTCAPSKDSDQPGHLLGLIWVFAGQTGDFVGFVMLWLISISSVWLYISLGEASLHVHCIFGSIVKCRLCTVYAIYSGLGTPSHRVFPWSRYIIHGLAWYLHIQIKVIYNQSLKIRKKKTSLLILNTSSAPRRFVPIGK